MITKFFGYGILFAGSLWVLWRMVNAIDKAIQTARKKKP